MKKIVMIGLLLMSLFVSGCQNNESKEKSDQEMDTTSINVLSNYEISDFDGNKINLKDYKNQKVYIKFWASWCPICLSGLKGTEELANEDNDFVVISIVAPKQNGEMNRDDFKQWFQGLDNNKFPVFFDENGEYTASMGVRGYPSSAFYNTNGELEKFQPGQIDSEVVKDVMQGIK